MKHGRLALAGVLTLAVAMPANAQVLQFDQVPGALVTGGNGVAIGNFYNGGGGAAFNYGVQFVGQANAFCFDYAGSTCSTNTSWGGNPDAIARNTHRAGMLFIDTPVMNRVAGFTTGFSFFYSNPLALTSAFEVWSGLNATGSLLASLSLSSTPTGSALSECFGDTFCPLAGAGVGFAGIAQSVRFTAVPTRSHTTTSRSAASCRDRWTLSCQSHPRTS